MKNTVFYSWQSDTDQKVNRYYLRECIKFAIVNLKDKHPLVYDESTEGVSGTPNIPASIFSKIEESSVAIFDVTCIKKLKTKKGTINPNVAIELGYAAHSIGWNRIILIINSAFGDTDRLPFHLKQNRFPLIYNYPSGAPKQDQKKLGRKLSDYISDALAHEHRAMARAKSRLSIESVKFIHEFGNQGNFNVEFIIPEQKKEIGRLLDVGLISFDMDPKPNGILYSYHWTPLGKELCKWYHSKKSNSTLIKSD